MEYLTVDGIANLIGVSPEIIMAAVVLLLAVSEALPYSSKIKANGVFQAIMNGLKALKGGAK